MVGIYITTRSKGFGYHAYPYDFWRYEIKDIRRIFSDFKIISLRKDTEPGILLKAQKPKNWKPKDLSKISLYSMLLGKRTRSIPNRFVLSRLLKVRIKVLLTNILNLFFSFYRSMI